MEYMICKQINKLELIFFYLVTWIQELLFNTNNFVCSQLKDFKYFYPIPLV